MKLPNGDQAAINIEKSLNYILDPLHGEGKHHAELFRRLIGIDRHSWRILDNALRAAARDENAPRPQLGIWNQI